MWKGADPLGRVNLTRCNKLVDYDVSFINPFIENPFLVLLYWLSLDEVSFGLFK